MKRKDLVNKLIKEGFNIETLVGMNDKQLINFHKKIMNEDLMVSKKDPQYTQKVSNAKKENKTIETYENKNELKGLVGKKVKKKSTKLKKSPMKISENVFTTKREILSFWRHAVEKCWLYD